MNTAVTRPVVVGYDGSPAAVGALEVGAAEAMSLGVPLRIVHAYVWPILYSSLANVPYSPQDWAAPETAVAMVRTVADRVAAAHPGLTVEISVVSGGGGPVLTEASSDASELVIGSRGAGGIPGLLAGSVAPFVAARSHCPVMVVRPGWSPRAASGPVCVGVDGTDSSLKALVFAAGRALREGAPLQVLHAQPASAFDEAAPELGGRTWAEARLASWVEHVRPTYPGLVINPTVVYGNPADTLRLASQTARLVVVGSRHRAELASLTLGSVGYSLLRHAACPVVVVHGDVAAPVLAGSPTEEGVS